MKSKKEPYNPEFERQVPSFLAESIKKVKKWRKTGNPFIDCYLDELNSSINVAEIENLISKEQANYLRNKYL